MALSSVSINRAPVLTLWAAVVAERLGYGHATALPLGKAVAGLNAQAKGRSLGIFGAPKGPERGEKPKKHGLGEDYFVTVLHRPVPVKEMPEGLRAVVKDQPIDPVSVEKYLASKFGEALADARSAMEALAGAYEADDLEELSYELYERFRPAIAAGKRGWGQQGELDLDMIREMAKEGDKEQDG